VSGVTFRPGGEHLVSGSQDKTVKVWDAITGDLVFTLKGHAFSVSSLRDPDL
jgi:WD40 repeat protein